MGRVPTTRSKGASDGTGTVTRWEEFDNYKAIDGVKVPFTIRLLEEAFITITLTEVRQNVSIEDSAFSKPK